MKPIITLTLNPSLDVAWDVEEMVPVRKVRASGGRTDPGGGGINASRVIRELGGSTLAVHCAGGLAGEFLERELTRIELPMRRVAIAGETRFCVMAYETTTGQEYRIVPKGPELSEVEWTACLDLVTELDYDYLLATGSLPEGVPNDYYARVARRVREKGARLVLDTSGMALFQAMEEGVYLVKPNQRELEHLMGRRAVTREEQESLCRELIDAGKAQVVALSLGGEGALLVWREGSRFLASPKVEVKSAVGAGDSFVGALALGLAWNRSLEEAFTLAVATGTATVLTSGTELCHRRDVERLLEELGGGRLPTPGLVDRNDRS